MRREIFIALPAYQGHLQVETAHSLLKLRDAIIERGWGVIVEDQHGSGNIYSVRNYFVARMLATEATDLLFIDDDVSFDVENAMRVLEAPVDFCAGVYCTRMEPIEWKVRYLQEKPELWADPETGLLEVEAVPAGFIRLSRDCLLRMVHAYGALQYFAPNIPDGIAWALFYPEIRDGFDYSEDFVFCFRWRAIGGKVWVWPLVQMEHIGRKAYKGCFGEWLLSRPMEAEGDGAVLRVEGLAMVEAAE